MARKRMTVLYAGRVQGVGFRYAVKTLACGFEIAGSVKNLPDGRVELVAEGEEAELVEFDRAIMESGMGPLVKQKLLTWSAASGGVRGFEIAA